MRWFNKIDWENVAAYVLIGTLTIVSWGLIFKIFL